ncbi:hypothetical protein B566_EDAN002170 [Ephemera danica]|nr:hypothetical protein B566_EDAN002170 [Ephemera danica]
MYSQKADAACRFGSPNTEVVAYLERERKREREGFACYDAGKEKLNVPPGEPVRLLLESDGTQVEDGEYFRTLPNNTVLLLLRPGERWYPAGVDVIRAAISAIPRIVCETIHSLELHDETPSWKIMDNKGRVTVVLHWDQRHSGSAGAPGTSGSHKNSADASNKFSASSSSSPNKNRSSTPLGTAGGQVLDGSSTGRPSLVIQTSLDKLGIHSTVNRDGKKETLINDVYPPRYSPQITVINHDDVHAAKIVSSGSSYGGVINAGASASSGGVIGGASATTSGVPRLSRQGSSFESTTIHIHTPECANHIHHPRSGSPAADTSECDFHCCALHEEGRKIQVHKSVATSPIQDAQQAAAAAADGRRTGALPKGTHVRFLDIEGESFMAAAVSSSSHHHQHHHLHHQQLGSSSLGGHDSSESETENTVLEEEAITTEKFLLLIDQLSVDQKRHLTIKDIGIILERLNSKIVDVERLDRESESDDCYNWTIKATIRGEVLRELGVIYNGNYYAISEHPGYKEESEENHEDVEEEEEEDRL